MPGFRPTDHSRPFMEIVRERAKYILPYPTRLVELFQEIDRARFIPPHLEHFRDKIYTNEGVGGLLSQPGVIFAMVARLYLKGNEIVYEGGTGTGYQTAILARMCKHVYSVEVDPERVAFARDRLSELGIENVTVVQGDAAAGLPEYAPFDRMIFGCAIHGQVDQHLIDQLSDRAGILVPTGMYESERRVIVGDLLEVLKKNGEVTQEIDPVFGGTLYFFPLISRRPIGWTPTKDGGVVPTSSLIQAQAPKQQKKWPWSAFAKSR